MKQQSYCYYPCFWEKKHQQIETHCPKTMQNMKTYTTSIWVKNRRCQQMVCVYEHGSQQGKIVFFPF